MKTYVQCANKMSYYNPEFALNIFLDRMYRSYTKHYKNRIIHDCCPDRAQQEVQEI